MEQRIADSLVPRGEGWAWNQVLMDLGAARCRPQPDCGDCPLARSCTWQATGRPEPDPAIGSAGVSTTQARFEGSDRQARGRVLKALGGGRLPSGQFDRRIVDGLVADGLVEQVGGDIALPS